MVKQVKKVFAEQVKEKKFVKRRREVVLEFIVLGFVGLVLCGGVVISAGFDGLEGRGINFSGNSNRTINLDENVSGNQEFFGNVTVSEGFGFVGDGYFLSNINPASVSDIWVNESGDSMSGNLIFDDVVNTTWTGDGSCIGGSGAWIHQTGTQTDMCLSGDMVIMGFLNVTNVNETSVNGSVTPGLNLTFPLGNESNWWSDLFVGEGHFSGNISVNNIGIGTVNPSYTLHLWRNITGASDTDLVRNYGSYADLKVEPESEANRSQYYGDFLLITVPATNVYNISSVVGSQMNLRLRGSGLIDNVDPFIINPAIGSSTSFTNTSTIKGFWISVDNWGNNSEFLYGLQVDYDNWGNSSSSNIGESASIALGNALRVKTQNSGNGSILTSNGLYYNLDNNADSNITTHHGIHLVVDNEGNITDMYGLLIDTPTGSGDYWRDTYGLYIGDWSGTGGYDDVYGLYVEGGNTYLGNNLTVGLNTLFVDATQDRVGVGTLTPDAEFEITSSTGSTLILDSEGGSNQNSTLKMTENGGERMNATVYGATNDFWLELGNDFFLTVPGNMTIGNGNGYSGTTFAKLMLVLDEGSGITNASLAFGGVSSGAWATSYGWIQARDADTANYISMILNPSGGSVGIGNTTPAGALTVTGNEVRIGSGGTINIATGDGDLYVQDDIECDDHIQASGNLSFGTNQQLRMGGDDMYIKDNNGNFWLKSSGNFFGMSDTDWTFDIDDDNDGDNTFNLRNGGNTNVWNVDEDGDQQMDGVLDVDGTGTNDFEGSLDVAGSFQANDYYSGDGTQGGTATVYVDCIDGNDGEIVYKDGLYVSTNCTTS